MAEVMTQTTTRPPLNGVDTPTLFATIDVVKANPPLARFRFRSTHRWLSGTHSQGTIETFSGAGADHRHTRTFTLDADHPAVLVGQDNGPLPVEYVLNALGSCIMSGIANIAAARGVKLTEVEATVEGDMDARGILGLSQDVRNGYEGIRATFRIKGDAPPEKLRQIVEQARARSAVFDVISNPVPVAIEVEAG
jgi:uncharacterized OsmC-like protein